MTRRSDSSWLLSALLCSAQALESVCLLYIRPRLNLSCFILLNTSSRPAHCWLVCVNLKSYFVLLNTSTRSARCWLVSASTFFCFVFLNPCSSTRSALYWEVSRSSLNTLTFIRSVLISSSALWRSSDFFLLMFHSYKFLSILTIFSSLSNRFLSCCFLNSSELYQRPVIWRVKNITPVCLAHCLQFILEPDWSSVLRPSYCEDVLNLHHINFVDFLANFLGKYLFEQGIMPLI